MAAAASSDEPPAGGGAHTAGWVGYYPVGWSHCRLFLKYVEWEEQHASLGGDYRCDITRRVNVPF